MIAIIIGIDHGYYAIKTRQVSFPSGIIGYDYEPYTMQNVLQYQGKYYVCGTGRQTLVKNKTSNDNYYLLTLAAIAEEIKHRKAERKTEVILAVGLPLSSFGREKQGFREYLLRKEQPVRFLYESELYEITIKDVKLFPQGYSALALHPEYVWYGGRDRSHIHYDDTRYYALNLHAVFSKGTLEWRCFESTLHAGKVRANITLALAISAQAINQRSTQMKKTLISENPAFTFRTFLLRLGLIGDEYKNVRKHLLANLDGDLAWRYDKSTYECLKKNQRTEGVR